MTQVLSGAFDAPRNPAPEGRYEMDVIGFEETTSQKGDSLNHNFTLAPTNGRNGLAYARVNFKPEWLQTDVITRVATVMAEYNQLPRSDQKAFSEQNKEMIRAGIALRQINRVAAWLGLVDQTTGEVNWDGYRETVSSLRGTTVLAAVNHVDINGLTRRQAKKQGLDFDEETVRAEGSIGYPKGFKTSS